MSELQKEAVRQSAGARVFAAIQPVYPTLSARFSTRELMDKAGLKGAANMYVLISVLERTFHCHRTAAGIWRKPEAA